MSEESFVAARKRMVVEQIAGRGVLEPRLLAVLECIPRHCFVSAAEHAWAYSDGPLPIGHGQTISQPYIVALMTELLQLSGDETVLEVGTGTGYQAAVLGAMAAQVHTVELIPELAETARTNLSALGCSNIFVHVGDGSLGWQEAAPYAGILVAAAAPAAPQPLLEQLTEGGRLVIPVGSHGFQKLEVWIKHGGQCQHHDSIPVAFVPLRGAYGWRK